QGHTSVMSLLLARQDVDVDAQCRGEERQALAYSCIRGHESVTKLLLAREDVNINAENKMGCTALIDVVVRYKTNNRAKEIVGLLLAQDNLEVTYRDRSGMTALIMACQKDFKEGVVLLL
ncbi:ankyrin repeat-containing domain protein, partial [Pyronema domesticum]